MSGCLECRHHHKNERRKALEVADGDLEIVTFDDEPETWFVCKHPKQLDKEMGKGAQAGEGCPFFEAPTRKGLDPALEKLLEKRRSR